MIHESLGIRHGSITTIHDLTNTESILDTPHKDLSRARLGHELDPNHHGFGHRDSRDLPRAARQVEWSRRARTAGQRLTDRLRVRSGT
ncbi:hypothetical protein LU656_25520 [Pseudomonas sp. NMI1173_11]|nr:hypothetical protein [Pseudomonas sp. NMI1173_11]